MPTERPRTLGFETPDLVSWLHDAANLIRNIDLCTHLLAAPDLDTETRRRVHQSALQTIAVLTDMFPSLRRPVRRRRGRQAVCELHEAIRSSVDLLQQRVRMANVTIEIVAASDLVLVGGNRGTYQRLIYHLMLNALEASTRGGRVTVTLTPMDGHVALVIADTGSGMSGSVRRRLFKEPMTTKRIGAGRGLMLAAATVATLGGTIAIESRLRKGTTVTLRFPVHPPPKGMKRVQ
jgi:two-component system, sporulation sensor kinase D